MARSRKPIAACQPVETSSSSNVAPIQQQLCDNLFDGVYFVDNDRRITYWNHGAEELTGYLSEEVVGRKCFDNILGHVNDDGCQLCHGGCPLSSTLQDGGRHAAEVYLRHKRGHRVPVNVRVSPVRDRVGQIIGAVEVFTDITAKKSVERRARELETLAYIDPLTGISNRRHIEMLVDQAVQESREFQRKIGMLLFDIDHFKNVNDAYGHPVGDIVLKTVADTLAHSLRPNDSIGRWGGEEFLMLAKDVDAAGLKAIAERCGRLIASTAITVGPASINLTISVGGAICDISSTSKATFEKIDSLLYQSKSEGRNRSTIA